MNAIFSIISLIQPEYFIRLYQRWRLQRDKHTFNLNQQEANLIFEGPPVDIAEKYAHIQKTMLFTVFYASLLPVGILISLGGLIISYWVDKCMLLRFHYRSQAIGKELALEMADFLELYIVVFSAGNMIFEKIVNDEVSKLNIAALVISFFIYILPQGSLETLILKKDKIYNEITSAVARMKFVSEYDRVNPVTKSQATNERYDLLVKIDEKEKEYLQAGKNEPRLASVVSALPSKGVFESLATYAFEQPSLRDVQKMNSSSNYKFKVKKPINMNDISVQARHIYGHNSKSIFNTSEYTLMSFLKRNKITTNHEDIKQLLKADKGKVQAGIHGGVAALSFLPNIHQPTESFYKKSTLKEASKPAPAASGTIQREDRIEDRNNKDNEIASHTTEKHRFIEDNDKVKIG